jgi:hypothetical protein
MGAPRGVPEGESGLILVGWRFASPLYLRGNLHASWGIEQGDTVSPSVSPEQLQQVIEKTASSMIVQICTAVASYA